MEWGKAKNYLIYILLGVNIFLFSYNIFNSYSWRISKETLRDTEKILADRGIVLEIPLPSKMYPRTKAQIKDYIVDADKLKLDLSSNEKIRIFDSKIEYFNFKTEDRVNIKNIDQVKKFLTSWLKNKGFDYKGWQISEYKYIILNANANSNKNNNNEYNKNIYLQVYDNFYKTSNSKDMVYENNVTNNDINIESKKNFITFFDYLISINDMDFNNTKTIQKNITQDFNQDSKMLALVLTQKYKNYMIYSNKIYFIVDKTGVKYFSSPKILKKVVSIYTDKDTPIVPAHQVLIANFTTPEIITGLDMGFSSYVNTDNSMKVSEEYPVWRVVTKSGKTFFFDAIEGKFKQ